MVAFIGNTLRGKFSGENFDESIASRQNLSDFSPVKVLRYTAYMAYVYIPAIFFDLRCENVT